MKFIPWILALSLLIVAQTAWAGRVANQHSAKEHLVANGTMAKLEASALANKGKLKASDKKMLKGELKNYYASKGIPVWAVALIIAFSVLLIAAAIAAAVTVRRRRARRARRRANRPPPPPRRQPRRRGGRPQVVIIR